MNRKLNFNELVKKQTDYIILANTLYEELAKQAIEKGNINIYYNKELKELLEEDENAYIEFFQYYYIGDSFSNYLSIEQIINNETLTIIELETERDSYYFLAVDHIGTAWNYVETNYSEEDIFNY